MGEFLPEVFCKDSALGISSSCLRPALQMQASSCAKVMPVKWVFFFVVFLMVGWFKVKPKGQLYLGGTPTLTVPRCCNPRAALSKTRPTHQGCNLGRGLWFVFSGCQKLWIGSNGITPLCAILGGLTHHLLVANLKSVKRAMQRSLLLSSRTEPAYSPANEHGTQRSSKSRLL